MDISFDGVQNGHPRAIAGALYVDHWEAIPPQLSLVSGGVDSWTSAMGRAIPKGTARPAYAPNGKKFGGKPVVKSNTAANAYLINNAITAISPGATRPWTYCIFSHDVIGAADCTYYFGNSASVQHSLDTQNSTQLRAVLHGTSAIGPATRDTARHTAQLWLDGTNANLLIDNAVLSTAAQTANNVSLTSMAIGAFGDGVNSRVSTASIAFIMMLSAKPTAAQILALEMWAGSSDGYPA